MGAGRKELLGRALPDDRFVEGDRRAVGLCPIAHPDAQKARVEDGALD